MRPETQQLRVSLDRLLVQLEHDLRALYLRLLDPRKLDATEAAWAAAVRARAVDYRAASAELATSYVEAFASIPALPDPGLPIRVFLASIHAMGIGGVKRAMAAGKSLPQAFTIGMVLSAGVVGRHVLDGGRAVVTGTVLEDPALEGWTRVGVGECDYCRRLINGDILDTPNFPSHDRCRCMAEPVRG